MPVYSISRASQYTTVSALETKGNQDGVSFNGFDAQGYASNFVVNLLTVCPTANRTWNYFNATLPVPLPPTSASVWYPYSITLTVSGGNPLGNGARPGIAYLNLYDLGGGYLMGSYTSNSLQYAGTTSITLTTGPSVQATTFNITNSRNTLTVTTTSTTYLAGFVAPTTSTSFWNIFARTTNQTAQNVYYDNSIVYNGTFSTATVNNSTQSLMGFINYNAAPVKPTNLVITTTTTGIQITCQCNEVQSLSVSSGTTVGDVSQILFLYSEDNVTYKVLTTETLITRTLVSGTTYQYLASASGTYTNTITLGRKYYFKVAAINDLCIQYQAESSTTRVAAGEDSDASFAQYGRQQFIKIRNVTNTAWVYPLDVNLVPTLTRIRNLGDTQWIYGDVYIRDASGNWVLN
jgi:hypothetical protein